MPTAKAQALEMIASLPDTCTLEDIQYHLYVREKAERGLKAIDEGRTVSQDAAEQTVHQWLESFKPKQP